LEKMKCEKLSSKNKFYGGVPTWPQFSGMHNTYLVHKYTYETGANDPGIPTCLEFASGSNQI